MPLCFQYAQQTYVGRSRMGSPNEDAVAVHVDRDHGEGAAGVQAVFCVADGMGGGQEGEVASRKILTGMLSCMADGRLSAFAARRGIPAHMTSHLLKEAVFRLNDELIQLAAAKGKRMGATLDALVVRGDRYHLAHVGDSRVYLIRSQRIQQLTDDHSAVEELVRRNVPRAHALRVIGAHVVTNIMGASVGLRVDLHEGDVLEGDCFVMCTDGLTSAVRQSDILLSVAQASTCQDACDQLVRRANERDGSDNITVLLARAQSVS